MGSRRAFIKQAISTAAIGTLTGSAPSGRPSTVKPARLRPGATVGLIAPARAIYEPFDVDAMEGHLRALGLNARRGRHIFKRYGYFAGTDTERAADLNAMFADGDVDAIFSLNGGWGAARVLELLEYDLIARHPKILLGFSDVTALLLAIYARTGLVTFHGPNGNSAWNQFSVEYLRRILFDGEAVTMVNPTTPVDNLAHVRDRVRTITPGTARGRLAGGNLTIVSSIVGSGFLPDWRGHILFLEDVGEDVYRVDRMLTQLRLAGVLDQIVGFVFGKCTDCKPYLKYRSFTLEDVLVDHLQPLGIPAWHGAMIGHIRDKFTVPVGVEAEIDAAAGTIRLLEPAVQ